MRRVITFPGSAVRQRVERRACARGHELVVRNRHVERGLELHQKLQRVDRRKSGLVEILAGVDAADLAGRLNDRIMRSRSVLFTTLSISSPMFIGLLAARQHTDTACRISCDDRIRAAHRRPRLHTPTRCCLRRSVTPGKITARPPIQTLSAMTIGLTSASVGADCRAAPADRMGGRRNRTSTRPPRFCSSCRS